MTTPIALVILGCVQVTTAQAQISRPRATHLDARTIHLKLIPPLKEGAHMELSAREERWT